MRKYDITAHLEADEYAFLRRLSTRTGRPLSAYVRDALRGILSAHGFTGEVRAALGEPVRLPRGIFWPVVHPLDREGDS